MTVRLMVEVRVSDCEPLVEVAVTVTVEVPVGVPVAVVVELDLVPLQPPTASEAPRARARTTARHLRLRRTARMGRLKRLMIAAPTAF